MKRSIDMGYYFRYYRLPTYIQEIIRRRFDEPFQLEHIEYGEQLLERQVEEDAKTFANFKGE